MNAVEISAIDFVKAFNAKNGWGTTTRDIFETLNESKRVFNGDRDDHRWWTTVSRVCEIEGKFIGYEYAECTGDDSLSDMGWEPDESSICFCEPYKVTQTLYRRAVPAGSP